MHKFGFIQVLGDMVKLIIDLKIILYIWNSLSFYVALCGLLKNIIYEIEQPVWRVLSNVTTDKNYIIEKSRNGLFFLKIKATWNY